jgi:hypothetical protein
MTLAVTREQAPGRTSKAKRDDVRGALTNLRRMRSGLPMPFLQRKPICACGGGCPRCKAEHPIVANADFVLPIVHEVLRSPGQPLDPATRAFMEPRFHHDFGQVRVHTDARAAKSARAVNALAYTVGRDVVFGSGRYSLATQAGNRLLAHELAHVVQQGARPRTIRGRLGMSQPHQFHEHEADAAAKAVMLGRKPRISSLASEVRIQRQGFGELRVAEARLEEESRIGASPIDGEFWIQPPRMPADAVPVFDDEDTQVVIGFRTPGSVTKVYDLEGTLVEISEPGLESPLIDPIDILAGGIFGLGRGLLRGGARAAARGAATRGGVAAAGRAGLRAIVSALSRRAVTALRGVYRAIRFRGPLNFTATTSARMADPARRVPQHILKLAIRFGTRSPDPQGAAGAFRYVIPMIRNGRQYTLEVVIREADKMVLHFLYR